jgi:hypothetical protein
VEELLEVDPAPATSDVLPEPILLVEEDPPGTSEVDAAPDTPDVVPLEPRPPLEEAPPGINDVNTDSETPDADIAPLGVVPETPPEGNEAMPLVLLLDELCAE